MWAKVTAVIEALKIFNGLIKLIVEGWNKWQDGSIDRHYRKKEEARSRIVDAMEEERKKPVEEQSDEKLKELHRRLRRLDASKL